LGKFFVEQRGVFDISGEAFESAILSEMFVKGKYSRDF